MAIICAICPFNTSMQTLKRALYSMDHVRVERRHLRLDAAGARVIRLFAVSSIRASVEEVIIRSRHGSRARGNRCLRHLQPDMTLRMPKVVVFKVRSLTAAHVAGVEVLMVPVAIATGSFIRCVGVNSWW